MFWFWKTKWCLAYKVFYIPCLFPYSENELILNSIFVTVKENWMFFLLPECINSFILNFWRHNYFGKNSCFDKNLTIFLGLEIPIIKEPTGFCISKQIYLFLLSVTVMGRLRFSLVQKLHILMLYAIALSVMVSFCANVYFMFI